ncbi:MAG: MATE family efflux transporter [Ruminococcaceae bacterium]|nr:MATE family efflux transporter [Oscillospiraceae bacterium]
MAKMTLREFFSPRDMSQGTPWKRIVEFSVPMLLGNIAQQLYNTVDSIVVGKYVGDNALAAVGSAGPIMNLLLVFFIGIATGAGILVSQYFGAKDREHLSVTIGNCITLTVLSSIFIMVVGPIIARPMLTLMDTPASILDWCVDYLNILFIGGIGSILYNMLSGILRGLGDSFSALAYLLVATILNIALDLLFVAGLDLGVAGVALATVIAQFISAIFCFIKLLKMRDLFDMSRKYIRPNGECVSRIVKLGLPSGLTQAIFSLSMVIVQSLTNSFGELFIACNVIIMRIDGFAMMPNFTFGQAMTTYTGQNVGARRLDRVHQGTRQGAIIAVGTSVVLVSLVLIFGKYLMMAFTDTPELIDMSTRMMRILAVGYIAVAITQVYSGVMRGAGDTMTPMWISLFTTVALRIPLAYGLAYLTRSAEYANGRPESLFISLLAVWIVGAIVTVIFFGRGKWRKNAEAAFQMPADQQ